MLRSRLPRYYLNVNLPGVDRPLISLTAETVVDASNLTCALVYRLFYYVKLFSNKSINLGLLQKKI